MGKPDQARTRWLTTWRSSISTVREVEEHYAEERDPGFASLSLAPCCREVSQTHALPASTTACQCEGAWGAEWVRLTSRDL